MYDLTAFNNICEVLGDNPTTDQEINLVSWIVCNVPKDEWASIRICLVDYDTAYSELSMRIGESGI